MPHTLFTSGLTSVVEEGAHCILQLLCLGHAPVFWALGSDSMNSPKTVFSLIDALILMCCAFMAGTVYYEFLSSDVPF